MRFQLLQAFDFVNSRCRLCAFWRRRKWLGKTVVDVVLWGSQKPFADGSDTVAVEATTVGGVLKGFEVASPALKPHLDAGVSAAVDGRIITNALWEPVRADSEVVLLQRIKGGWAGP